VLGTHCKFEPTSADFGKQVGSTARHFRAAAGAIFTLIAVVAGIYPSAATNPSAPGRRDEPGPVDQACAAGQPDGRTDNSACVQRMIDARCHASGNRSGGVVYLWPGHWRFHDITVRCDSVHIVGAGVGDDSLGANAQGTVVDCSAMTNHCIQFVPANFPGRYRMRGGSVQGIRFYNDGGVGTIIDINQVTNGYVRDVTMWKPPNGIRIFGSYAITLRDIEQDGVSGSAYEITGDNTGKRSNGDHCSLDCSTRTDWVILDGLTGSGFPSNVFLYIHDMAFTIYGHAVQQENGGTGLKVRCAPGKPDISWCPQQILMNGFNVEYAAAPVDVEDFTYFRCVTCYMAGNPSATKNVVRASLQHYQQQGGAGGGVSIVDSEIYGANGSCVWFDVTDTTIIGSQINGCNGSKSDGAGVEYHGGSQHHISDTTFCTLIGANVRVMSGILVDRGASKVAITAPMYYGCISGLVNRSASPETVTTVNAQGP
jgi:hypothetical protein